MLLFICSLIFLGFVTGIFVTIKSCQDFSLDLIQNIALKKYFLKELGFFGFLFLSLIFNLTYMLISFFLSYFKIGKILSILFFIYLAYLVGIDIVIIIKCLGTIRGIMFAIIGYALWRFIILFLLFIFVFKVWFYNNQLLCYGKCSISEVSKKLILTFSIIISFCVLVQSIVLLIFIKFFVFI